MIPGTIRAIEPRATIRPTKIPATTRDQNLLAACLSEWATESCPPARAACTIDGYAPVTMMETTTPMNRRTILRTLKVAVLATSPRREITRAITCGIKSTGVRRRRLVDFESTSRTTIGLPTVAPMMGTAILLIFIHLDRV